MIINFVLFCLAVIGMTNIVVDSSLFQPVREWLQSWMHKSVYELFECHQCCGTWCGFICGACLLSYNPFFVLMCGCAGSFLASAYYLISELIISKTDFDIEIPEPTHDNFEHLS